MLAPLKLQPGIYRNGTNYESTGRYYDGSLVRFFEGTIRPVGGWRKIDQAQTALNGKARGLHSWRTTLSKFIAVGTHTKLYLSQDGGAFSDITPASFVAGRADSSPGYGYGFGSYGSGNWNDPPTGTERLDATTWSLDNWGDWLVGCSSSDGKIYKWNPSTGGVATVITPAAGSTVPTNNHMILVTPERHLLALGAGGDPRKIQWCSQERLDIWAPLATNTAGDLQVQSQGRIVTGRKVRGQTLILTDQDAHVLTYQGYPFIYGIERVGTGCGCVGPNAVAVMDKGALWMGRNGFFAYNGAVNPIPSEVSDYVFSDLNLGELPKVAAGHNSLFREVWWFYPSANSSENDRYVLYNYAENHWSIGTLSRTCWADAGVLSTPLAASADGYIYAHESGWDADGTPILTSRFLRSGPVEIGNGDSIMHVRQVIPDERSAGKVRLRFATQFTPEGSEFAFGPYTLAPYTDVRLSGRQVAMQIEGMADEDWRVGTIRMDGTSGGRR